MMKIGSRVRVITPVDGRYAMLARITFFTPSGEFAEVVYDDLSWGLVHLKNMVEITDGVANAAFSKPDNGEDCR